MAYLLIDPQTETQSGATGTPAQTEGRYFIEEPPSGGEEPSWGDVLGRGAKKAVAGTAKMVANMAGLIDWVGEKVQAVTGEPKNQIYPKIRQYMLEQAKSWTPEQVQNKSFLKRLAESAIENILRLPEYALFAAAGGPVLGFAAHGALSEADKGPKEVLRGAAGGALTGGLFKVTEPLKAVARGFAVGAPTTASALVEGASPEEALGHGLMMGLMGGVGHKGDVSLADAYRTLRNQDWFNKMSDAQKPKAVLMARDLMNQGVEEKALPNLIRREFSEQKGTARPPFRGEKKIGEAPVKPSVIEKVPEIVQPKQTEEAIPESVGVPEIEPVKETAARAPETPPESSPYIPEPIPVRDRVFYGPRDLARMRYLLVEEKPETPKPSEPPKTETVEARPEPATVPIERQEIEEPAKPIEEKTVPPEIKTDQTEKETTIPTQEPIPAAREEVVVEEKTPEAETKISKEQSLPPAQNIPSEPTESKTGAELAEAEKVRVEEGPPQPIETKPISSPLPPPHFTIDLTQQPFQSARERSEYLKKLAEDIESQPDNMPASGLVRVRDKDGKDYYVESDYLPRALRALASSNKDKIGMTPGVVFYHEFVPNKKTFKPTKDGPHTYINDKYYSDGRFAVKIDRSRLGNVDLRPVTMDVSSVFSNRRPAEIGGEMAYNLENKPPQSMVHVRAQDGSDYIFDPKYVNTILTEYPHAKPSVEQFKNNLDVLVFRDGDEIVGFVAPLSKKVYFDKRTLQDVVRDFGTLLSSKTGMTIEDVSKKRLREEAKSRLLADWERFKAIAESEMKPLKDWMEENGFDYETMRAAVARATEADRKRLPKRIAEAAKENYDRLMEQYKALAQSENKPVEQWMRDNNIKKEDVVKISEAVAKARENPEEVLSHDVPTTAEITRIDPISGVIKQLPIGPRHKVILEAYWKDPQTFAHDHPESRAPLDVETRRQWILGETQNRLHRMAEPFYSLPKREREGLEKIIIEGDRVGKEYSDEELIDLGLNGRQIEGYRAQRRAWNAIIDDIERFQLDMAVRSYKDRPWVDELRDALETGEIPDALKGNEEFVAGYQRLSRPVSAIKTLMDEVRKRPGYFHRHRKEGNWAVLVYDQDQNQVGRYHYLSEAAAERAAKAWNAKEGMTAKYIPIDRAGETLFQSVNRLSLEAFLNRGLERLEREGKYDPETITDMHDAMVKALTDEIRARGWGEHLIARKEGSAIAGYETTNLHRVLFDSINGYAGWKSKYLATVEHLEAIADMRDRKVSPEIINYWSRYAKDVLRNSETIDRAAANFRGVAYMYYLLGNLKQFYLQFTQNLTMGLPLFHARGGTTADYARTMRDVAIGRLTPQEQAFLALARIRRDIDDPYTAEVSGKIEGAAYPLKAALEIVNLPLSGMERFNRSVTMLAEFRRQIGLGKDFDAAYKAASDFTFQANHRYGKANLPQWARSEGGFSRFLARSAYTFSSYPHQYVMFLKRFLNDHQYRAFAESLGMTAVFGGAVSVPFIDSLVDIIERSSGSPLRRNMIMKLKSISSYLERALLAGLPGLFGFDVSGSFRIDLPIYSFFTSSETDPLDNVFGVYASMIKGMNRSIELVKRGEYVRALEEAGPVALKNFLKGTRGYYEGMTTWRGTPIYDYANMEQEGLKPMRYTRQEAIGQRMGFLPFRRSEASHVMKSFMIQRERADRVLERLSDQYVTAYNRGDREAMSKIIEGVAEHDLEMSAKGMPEFMISHRFPGQVIFKIRPSRRAVMFNMPVETEEATREQVFRAFPAIANLADKSDGARVRIRIEGSSAVGFDPSWLRNAVDEPLDEADIERTAEE